MICRDKSHGPGVLFDGIFFGCLPEPLIGYGDKGVTIWLRSVYINPVSTLPSPSLAASGYFVSIVQQGG
jgi:hypothetical protein